MKKLQITVDIAEYISQYLNSKRNDFIYYAVCELNLEDYVDAYATKTRKLVDIILLGKLAYEDEKLQESIKVLITNALQKTLKNDDEEYFMSDLYDILEKWAVAQLIDNREFVKSMKQLHDEEKAKAEKSEVKKHITALEKAGFTVTKKK